MSTFYPPGPPGYPPRPRPRRRLYDYVDELDELYKIPETTPVPSDPGPVATHAPSSETASTSPIKKALDTISNLPGISQARGLLNIGSAAAGAVTGLAAKALGSDAYGRSLQENAEGMTTLAPGEAPGFFESLRIAPGPGQVLAEAIAPGTPESAGGRIAKQVGSLAGDVILDPLNLATAGAAGASKLAKLATRGERVVGELAPILGRVDQGLDAAVDAVKAAQTISRPAAAARATAEVLGSAPAAAIYGPEVLGATLESGERAYEAAREGRTADAFEAGTSGVLTGALGALMGRGVYSDLSALRAGAQSRSRLAEAAEKQAGRASNLTPEQLRNMRERGDYEGEPTGFTDQPLTIGQQPEPFTPPVPDVWNEAPPPGFGEPLAPLPDQPVDVLAEREALTPDLNALSMATQARLARDFRRTQLEPTIASAITTPPAPRLGTALAPLQGPGAEDVTFSPAGLAALAAEGVQGTPTPIRPLYADPLGRAVAQAGAPAGPPRLAGQEDPTVTLSPAARAAAEAEDFGQFEPPVPPLPTGDPRLQPAPEAPPPTPPAPEPPPDAGVPPVPTGPGPVPSAPGGVERAVLRPPVDRTRPPTRFHRDGDVMTLMVQGPDGAEQASPYQLRRESYLKKEKRKGIQSERMAPGVRVYDVSGKKPKPLAKHFDSWEGAQVFARDAWDKANLPAPETPRYVYRARNVGEEGVPAVSHAQASASEADVRRVAPSRTEDPQEVVRIDLNRIEPDDYEVIERPGQPAWIRFKKELPEEAVERVGDVDFTDIGAASKAPGPLRRAVADAAPTSLARATGLTPEQAEKGVEDVRLDGMREFSPEAVAVKKAVLTGEADVEDMLTLAQKELAKRGPLLQGGVIRDQQGVKVGMAGSQSRKSAFGLAQSEFPEPPAKIAKAIERDADNPLYLRVKEEFRRQIQDQDDEIGFRRSLLQEKAEAEDFIDPTTGEPRFATRAVPGQRGLFGAEDDVAPPEQPKAKPTQGSLFGQGSLLQGVESRTTEGREAEGALFRQEAAARERAEAEAQTSLPAEEAAPSRLARAVQSMEAAERGEELPPRTADTMSEAIALSSPSGNMSQRAKDEALRRLGEALFGPGGGTREQIMGKGPPQPTERERDLAQAKRLRDHSGGGKNRKFIKEAERLEAKHAEPESGIADFGEKIGGARKDTARPLGKKQSAPVGELDERPAWLRKYRAFQDENAKIKLGDDAPFTLAHGDSIVYGPNYKPMEFKTKEEAEKAATLYEVSRNHRIYPEKDGKRAGMAEGVKYGIFRSVTDRKHPLVKGGFESEEAARKYMVTNAVEIIEKKFDFPDKPWLDRIERVGQDRRGGKDVTTSQFGETFGFRGGEFGNWNMGSDGQAALNHAYDALLDLADALGVPPKALSLNGELAIAFGARGHGGKDSARAHYEPERSVINLTKIKGAGSLAHEWWHALDNYLGREGATGKADPRDRERMPSAHGFRYQTTTRPELKAAFDRVIQTMTSREKTGPIDAAATGKIAARTSEATKSTLDGLRRTMTDFESQSRYNKRYKPPTDAQLAEWDRLAARILEGEPGKAVWIEGKDRRSMGRQTFEAMEDLNAIYKAITNRSFATADENSTGKTLYWNIKRMLDTQARMEEANKGATETRRVPSLYLHDAKDIDELRASDYWSTPQEMGARAFESFIYDKLKGGEQRSDYLTYGVENRFYKMFNQRPYPDGSERVAINEAFENLFKTVQTKETEKGTALYQERKPYQPLQGRTREEEGAIGFDRAMALEDEVDWRGGATTKLVGEKGYRVRSKAGDLSENLYDTRAEAESYLREAQNRPEPPPEPLPFQRRRQEPHPDATRWTILDSEGEGLGTGEGRTAEEAMADFRSYAGNRAAKVADAVPEEDARFATRAFHGSPHDFDRFTTEKMGTGEGAQAYGWGMYFAGDKEVAEHYRKRLAGGDDHVNTIHFNGEPILTRDGWEENYWNLSDKDRNYISEISARANYFQPKVALARVEKDLRELVESLKVDRDQLQREGTGLPRSWLRMNGLPETPAGLDEGIDFLSGTLDFLKKNEIEIVGPQRRGKLYEVDLKPEEHEYLLWDKPLEEQSPQVRAAIEGMFPRAPEDAARIEQLMARQREIEKEAAPLRKAYYDSLERSPLNKGGFVDKEGKAHDVYDETTPEYADSEENRKKLIGLLTEQQQNENELKSLKARRGVTDADRGSTIYGNLERAQGNRAVIERQRALKEFEQAALKKGWLPGVIDDTIDDLSYGGGQVSNSTRTVTRGTELEPLVDRIAQLYGSRRLSADMLTSQQLRDAGVRGIKFLDGNSRGRGQGNYNYVIFHDDDVEVLAKYKRKQRGISAEEGNRRYALAEQNTVPAGDRWTVANPDESTRDLSPAVAEASKPLLPVIDDVVRQTLETIGEKGEFAGLTLDHMADANLRNGRLRLGLMASVDTSIRKHMDRMKRGRYGDMTDVQRAKMLSREIARHIVNPISHEAAHLAADTLAKSNPEYRAQLDDTGHGKGFALALRDVYRKIGAQRAEMRRSLEAALDADDGALRQSLQKVWGDLNPHWEKLDAERRAGAAGRPGAAPGDGRGRPVEAGGGRGAAPGGPGGVRPGGPGPEGGVRPGAPGGGQAGELAGATGVRGGGTGRVIRPIPNRPADAPPEKFDREVRDAGLEQQQAPGWIRYQPLEDARAGKTEGKPPDEPINLSRIAEPADVVAMESRVADALKRQGKTDEAKGYRSWEEAREKAVEAGLTEADFKRLLKEKGALTDVEIEAGRMLRETAFVDARQKAAEMQRLRSEGKDAGDAQRAYEAAVTRAAGVLLSTVRAGGEAGRALAIHRKMSQSITPEEAARFRGILADPKAPAGKKEEARYKLRWPIQDEAERLTQRLIKENPAVSQEFVARLLQTDPKDARAVNALLRAAFKPKLRNKLYELWINGLLSGIPTHLANMTGNTVTQLLRIPEKAMAGALDAVGAKLTGRPRERFVGEAYADLMGIREGIRKGLAAMKEDWRDEFGIKDSGKLEHAVGAIGGRTGSVVRAPTRALSAEDQFFKALAATRESRSLAYRKARSEGKSGRALNTRIEDILSDLDSHPDILEGMAKEADYQTFTKKLGRFGRMMMAARDADPSGVASVIVPFMRTPLNIAKYTLERTPLNFLRLAAKGSKAEEYAKPMMGTLLGLSFALAAKEGLLTGGGPADHKERENLEATGWQPYSVKAGDDYISYKRIEPLAAIMGFAADLVETKDEQTQGDLVNKIVGSIAENLTNKTFLQGVEDLSLALSDPRRYASQYAKSMEGSLVPSIVARTAQATDDTFRETSALDGSAIAARLPGVSTLLEPRRTGTGEPRKRQGTALERFASPLPRTTEKGPEADLERAFAHADFTPTQPGRFVTIPKRLGGRGERVELSARELKYLREVDERVTAELRKRVASPKFRNMDPRDMKQLFERAYRQAGTAARDRVVQSREFRQRAAAAVREARDRA